MTSNAALQALTEVVFAAIFFITLAAFVRHPNRERAEVAALFGSLAAIIALSGFSQLTGIQLRTAGLVAALFLLSQPYLQLRLVAHFRPLPRVQHAIGLLFLVASWAVMIVGFDGTQLPPPLTLAIVVAFAYVEGYATLAFVRAALHSRGVTQRRLVAVASGSGCLATVILLAGARAFMAGGGPPVLQVLSNLLGLGSALGYYLGFAPPAWLRRIWQQAEFQLFLAALTGRSADDRFVAALDLLGPAAARAVGAKAAVVALGAESSTALIIHPDPDNEQLLAQHGLATLPLSATSSPTLTAAWQERRAIASQASDWGPALHEIAAVFGGASSALVSPLTAYGQSHGLLILLFERHSMFLENELELLVTLADQAALAIAGAQIVAQLHQQNATLEAASRMKSEFLANMSHELRTPLNAILGFSELLLDSDDTDPGAQARAAYLERIHDSGQHLLQLINDILDLSKVEAGRMELRPERFQAAIVIAAVLTTVGPLAVHKDIELAAEANGAGELQADLAKFKQVLYNLLSNAIKFTPEGGRVTVSARPEDGFLHLVVSDTGIGIALQDQERVFGEFQQVDSGANRRHEGTGLGLALTKRFVEMHQGRMWLESNLGQGSHFHVLLPLGAAEPATRPGPAALAEPAPPAAGALVLVVEDDPSAAHLMSVYLARGGYRVELAGDGRQALDKARALSPAAITLDVMLPEIDGWEVLRELKADPATRDIPVIIASVVDDQPLGYALGATEYLAKPVDREVLLARIARYALDPAVSSRRAQLLVVDDDASARELIVAALQPLDANVTEASSGSEALALVRAQPPDLLLLDLLMPEMSGFDVLARLRLDPHTRDIPVVIVTAKDLTPGDRAALNGGVKAIFNKSELRMADLSSTLASLLPAQQSRELSGATT